MKQKNFLYLSAILFILFIVGYFFLVDKQLTSNRLIPKSYKQFMLESSVDYPGNKILIVGGSDAHHGINALMMEKAFGRPVLNLADNGGFALRHKIYNVLKYVKGGDIVIFSLGWHKYYSKQNISQHYISAVSDKSGTHSFYYENLPLDTKIKFVFKHLPYKVALNSLVGVTDNINYISQQYQTGNELSLKIMSHERDTRGSSLVNITSDNLADEYGTCDNYAFYDAMVRGLLILSSNAADQDGILRAYLTRDIATILKYKNGHGIDETNLNILKEHVSPYFNSLMKLIDKIRKKGAQIFFVWPIVVDDKDGGCYSSKLAVGLSTFAGRIRQTINDHGYQILGDYNDSLFSYDCFYNTHAHITADCADIRTRKLIDELMLAGEIASDSNYKNADFDKVLLKRFSTLRDKLDKQAEKDIATKLKVLPTSGAKVNSFRNHLLLTTGWSTPEHWGTWSEGYDSRIILKIMKARIPKTLIIKGRYFSSIKNTVVYINDKYIGDYNLVDTKIDIPSGTINSEFVHIKLKHKSPISPNEINTKNNDFRKLAYGLEYINLL